jgi:hypothetical protein
VRGNPFIAATLCSAVSLCCPAAPAAARDAGTPTGIIAASVGDEVVLADPATGAVRQLEAGPVAWLFPAPGGVLFAPDLVHGSTTVIDLRTQTAGERLPGVTMPRFGQLTDRYVVVSSRVLVVSYPERALMSRFEIAFERPWQVAVAAGNSVLLVLEREPEGEGGAVFSAVQLDVGRLVYRRPLEGDVRHFALSPTLGVVAFADRAAGRVVLAEPAALAQQAAFDAAERPADLAFVGDGSTLAVAAATATGGALHIWKLDRKQEQPIEVRKSWQLPLAAAPLRLAASPDGRHVAVALAGGQIQIFDVVKRVAGHSVELGAPPRDLVWCDPTIPGPSLPVWSDTAPPSLELGN